MSAARSPGWEPYVVLAQGLLGLCCDDFEGARQALERVLAVTAPAADAPWPLSSAWVVAVAAHVESLIGLGRNEEARHTGERALATCSALEIGVASHGISRAVALAEAKTGAADLAAARLSAVIRNQTDLGVTGVQLGASFEARARVAIAAGDREGFENYARLTALEYRHGRGSPLGTRYERLARDGLAVHAGVPSLAEFDSASSSRMPAVSSLAATRLVGEVMKDTGSTGDRALRVLDVLCDATGASRAHLYWVRDGGLELAASRPPKPPPPSELAAFVHRRLAEAVDDSAPTVIMEDGATGGTFSDDGDVRYSALLLGALEGGAIRYAAVAALALDDGARAVPQEIVVALAEYLIRRNETGGATIREAGLAGPPAPSG